MTVVDVDISGIRAHADRVEDVGGRVDLARRAAGQVSMTGEAYGVLCSPLLVPVLGALEASGIAGMATIAAAVDGTATALRTTANSLQMVDEVAAGSVQQAGGGGR